MKSSDIAIFGSTVATDIASLRGGVVSVGNFDGVHLGHRAIIDTMRAAAREPIGVDDPIQARPVVAVTFEPHPLELLRPAAAPKRLTPWGEKVRQLAAAGVDAVVRLTADADLLTLEPEAFVADVLVKYLRPACIVEGPDFGFGRARRGNVELLQSLANLHDYNVRIVHPIETTLPDGVRVRVRVSSTAIRERISLGAVDAAAAMLGRPYALVGTVVHGAGAGRNLGYPTLNLNVGNQAVPGEGVYAGRAEIDEKRYLAAISIGTRATLGGDRLVIEAFLLDVTGDWYGREARVELHARLRDQRRFADQAALVAQIGHDVAAVRRIMA